MSEEEKSGWSKIVEKVLSWLKIVLPIAALMTVWRWMEGKVWKAEREVDRKEMEIAKHAHREQVQKDNEGKSNRDIVRDAIDAGKRIGDRNRKR